MNASFAEDYTVTFLSVDLGDQARVVGHGARRHDIALVASLYNSESAVAWALIRKNEFAHDHSSIHLSVHVLVCRV